MRQTLIRALRRLARPFGVALTIAIAFYHAYLGLYAPPMLERLEALFYDLRFRVALEAPPIAQKIVIVDIDETSIDVEGRWPWSRARMGDMLAALYDNGAIIVGFDVTFPEPERNPVDEVLTDPAIAAHAGNTLRAARARFDADAKFAQDIARGETVLGFFLHNDTAGHIGALPEPILTLPPGEGSLWLMPETIGYAGNQPVLQDAAVGAGSLTTEPDVDGVVRRSPMIYRVGDQLYPSLSLAVVRRFLGAEHVTITTAMQGDTVVMESVALDGNLIPVDARGRAVVPYRGKAHSFPYVSATDVLHGAVDRDVLDGAIVLVGTSALGLKDLRSTPLETGYPGVEVHANLLDAMIGQINQAQPAFVGCHQDIRQHRKGAARGYSPRHDAQSMSQLWL